MQLRFSQGDIYAPNDLTMEELKMRRSKRRNVKDVFDVLGVNPMTLYKVRELWEVRGGYDGQRTNGSRALRTTRCSESMSPPWDGLPTRKRRGCGLSTSGGWRRLSAVPWVSVSSHLPIATPSS